MNLLVTGANRGLGLEFVKQYAEEGATVYACCRNPGSSTALRKLCDEAGGKISMHALDVASAGSVAALANSFRAEPIDILINNAGIHGPEEQSADDMDFEGWAETFAVNTLAPLRMAQAFHENLVAGRQKKLVTLTSSLGCTVDHDGTIFAYRSSKAAVNNVMHGLARAWRKEGIIVSLIHPGWVKTDMGGPHAHLEAHESVAGMLRVIGKLKLSDSGRFLDHSGHELPW